jgi:hypothetical protein
VCTPRQVRAGVPALLDAITYRALLGQAPDAPLRAQTPAGLALALSRVQRPSYQQVSLDDEAACGPARAAEGVARARHARRRGGLLHPTSLLRPAV